jgi:hypothetical protein
MAPAPSKRTHLSSVMPALVAGIHVLCPFSQSLQQSHASPNEKRRRESPPSPLRGGSTVAAREASKAGGVGVTNLLGACVFTPPRRPISRSLDDAPTPSPSHAWRCRTRANANLKPPKHRRPCCLKRRGRRLPPVPSKARGVERQAALDVTIRTSSVRSGLRRKRPRASWRSTAAVSGSGPRFS